MAAAIYCSYFFGAILIAQAVFVLIGHYRQWLRMRPVLLISPILTGIFLLPVIPILLAASKETYLHVSNEMPSWTDLGIAWMPPRWVVAAVVATGILALLRPGKVQFIAPATEPSSPLSRSAALYWLALLAVTPALLLFLFSQITRTSVFVPRYFLSMTPGLAVLGAFAVHCCQPPMWRGSFAATLFTISMLASGTRLWTKHQVEDWRGASAMLTRIRQAEPDVMILAGGQFVESRFLAFPVDAVQRRWLLAPQNAYPIPGQLELLPLAVGPASEAEVRKVLNKAAEQDHFFIVLPPASPITQWTFGRFLEEYRSVVLHADPLVVRFERRVRR